MRVVGLKRTPRVLLGLLAIVLASCRTGEPDKAERRPGAVASPRGIVLVTIDGWWDPATKTDSIPSDFAETRLRLSSAMTPCPQVRPAVCATLTGKTPIESGVRDDISTPLPATVPLITEKLTEKGWRTAAFIADPRVGVGSGLERGFEVFDSPKESLLGSFRHLPKVREPRDVVSDFATWIPTVPDDASFFAWVHLTRPMIDPRAEGSADDVRTALLTLSQVLNGSAGLKRASVMLLGTAGRIDLDDGANSGYFLTPDVLRVPVLVRSRGSGDAGTDPRVAFSLLDVAPWIAREAGLEAAAAAPGPGSTPRLAWTWRGHIEFGWPSEVAAQLGSALCAREVPGAEDRCVPWEAGHPADEADRRSCAAKLSQETQYAQIPSTLATLPVDLLKRLKTLGLPMPAARTSRASSVARDLRVRVVPSITKARRLADHRKAIEADTEYQKALALDPKNFGALIEAGEALALEGRPKLAKARLEPAMRAASWSAEAWHWSGHVSALEQAIDRAEAQWLVADVLEPGNADVLYDLACARSLSGDVAGSEAYLRRAWRAGYKDVNAIQADADLRNLRADPAFLRFMREVVH